MLVRITRNTVAGGVAVAVGQVVDIGVADARVLIALRKAVPIDPVDARAPKPMTTDAPESAALVATETATLPRAKPRKGA